MRRVMVFALLALALPTAALASSISFTASSAPGNNATVGEGGVDAQVFGPEYTIVVFSTGPITACCPPFLEIFGFTSGTLEVFNTSTGALVFQNSVTGTGEQHGPNITVIGNLEPNASVKNGTFSFAVLMSGEGHAGVSATLVPEPSAFEGLLLGTGMLGLAEMTRRKLRLGT